MDFVYIAVAGNLYFFIRCAGYTMRDQRHFRLYCGRTTIPRAGNGLPHPRGRAAEPMHGDHSRAAGEADTLIIIGTQPRGAAETYIRS